MPSFWRSAFLSAAAAAGCFAVFVGLLNLVVSRQLDPVVQGTFFGFIMSFLPCLIAVVIFRRLAPQHWNDSETRCRKCGYILRGISEPRCPECGEVI